MPEEEQAKVGVTILRMGYGHIRAGLAITDALSFLGVDCRLITISDYANPLLKAFLNLLDSITGIGYRDLPNLSIKISQKYALQLMNMANRICQLLDRKQLNKKLGADFEIHIATHSISTALINQKTILLVLDPYGRAYNSINPNVIYAVPDLSTAEEIDAIGRKRNENRRIIITGPFIALSVINAKNNYRRRIEGLTNGDGLKVAIATGGSLSHVREILDLTDSYIESMTKGSKINEISIVVGSSEELKTKIEMLVNQADQSVKNRVQIIFDRDQLELVHRADHAFSQSDVIHAKTGELVYAVAGGKVFETLHPPCLAIQEIKLKEYVEKQTEIQFEGKITSSLEIGETDSHKEIEKLLAQLENGLLIKRMESGLKIPTGGANHIADLIRILLKNKPAEILSPGIHNLLLMTPLA